jgi:hypothetical protein
MKSGKLKAIGKFTPLAKVTKYRIIYDYQGTCYMIIYGALQTKKCKEYNKMNNENINVENKVESVDATIMDASVIGVVERQKIGVISLTDIKPSQIKENTVRSEEQINMDKYTQQYEFASYFPGLEERSTKMAKMYIKPEPDVNTGALRGDALHEAGMSFLAEIKKEIFDGKPAWEKELIKEGKIGGKVFFDELYEEDDITPRDGRPRLTVEYLRSIGYDIDIS